MLRSILLLFLCAAPLAAQTDRPVTLGDRVRIRAPKAGYPQITGNVVATTPDVLSISVGREATEVAVPRERIDQLLLSVSSKRHVPMGALIGAAFGAGVAWKFGPRADVVPGTTIQRGQGSTRNLVTGAISGAAIGALVGYFAETDAWVARSPMARLP